MASFKCPECGHTRGSKVFIDPAGPPKPGDPPWASVLQIIHCAKCHKDIPAHLGESWDGITVERAREEWERDYRDG